MKKITAAAVTAFAAAASAVVGHHYATYKAPNTENILTTPPQKDERMLFRNRAIDFADTLAPKLHQLRPFAATLRIDREYNDMMAKLDKVYVRIEHDSPTGKLAGFEDRNRAMMYVTDIMNPIGLFFDAATMNKSAYTDAIKKHDLQGFMSEIQGFYKNVKFAYDANRTDPSSAKPNAHPDMTKPLEDFFSTKSADGKDKTSTFAILSRLAETLDNSGSPSHFSDSLITIRTMMERDATKAGTNLKAAPHLDQAYEVQIRLIGLYSAMRNDQRFNGALETIKTRYGAAAVAEMDKGVRALATKCNEAATYMTKTYQVTRGACTNG